jgi:hypothetical protein
MSLVLSGSTSGSVTLQEPAVAGTTVIDLPATSGTMVVTGGAQTVQFAAGTVSAPSITFTGDTNTGIFSPAADTIAFTEGGVESMRVDSSGNLGIGTTSPAFGAGSGVELVRSGTATYRATSNGQGVEYRNNAGTAEIDTRGAFPIVLLTNQTERMRITSGGNVGIGVTPAASTVVTLQLGTSTFSEGGGATSLASNMVRDTTWKAINTGTSGLYQVSGNSHYWYTAASASSGATVALTERMRIEDSYGAVLIGVTTASTTLYQEIKYTTSYIGTRYINTSSSFSTAIDFVANSAQVGRITTSGSATTYSTSSDYRLKENIAPMTGALAKVAQLKPCTYTWKVNGSNGEGFIAHELQEICPDAVVGEKDAVDKKGNIKPQGVDTSFLVATLTAAIQEQQQIINDLKARIETLEGAK